MVGLTDSTIARHSEEPIPGMVTTWKEAKHNSRYILESAPDYIAFSTGVKPSAPAEKALMLYRPFLDSYKTVSWLHSVDPRTGGGLLNNAFKRFKPIEGDLVPTMPLAFVDNYKLGTEMVSRQRYREALPHLDSAIMVSPRPIWGNLLYQKGLAHKNLQQGEMASRVFDFAVQSDSLTFGAHRELYILAHWTNDTAKARIHANYILKMSPWYFPRVDSIAKSMSARARQLERQGVLPNR
jgi:tetratricopeptide (TPR) repeat protein